LGFDSKAVGPGRTWVLRHQRSTSEEKRQKRGDVELINYLQDAAGARNLVLDLSVTHARHGSSSQTRHNGLLTHPQVPDGPLHVAARKKISAYRPQYANNRLISFMPAITSTSCTASFCVSSFYSETVAHLAIGLPAQQHCDSFRVRRAAFYNGLKSKVGWLRPRRRRCGSILCGAVAPPVHSSSRYPLLLASLLAHNFPLPRAAQ